jgi:hypothetical protein
MAERDDLLAREPRPCPWCGAVAVLETIYGYPSPELGEAARQGRVLLGGCVVSRRSMRWYCCACHREWEPRLSSRDN